MDKHPDLDATLVHAGGIDISIADFKSIQMNIPTEDKQRLDEFQKSKGKNGFEVGWLNDQVRIVIIIKCHIIKERKRFSLR